MSFDIDIWQELGISATQDKKAIKKAYAKKLKVVSPEKDPEGFKRLRWAYEQVLNRVNNLNENDFEIKPSIDSESLEKQDLAEVEPFNLIKEIIRCLNYSLESQAIAYLEEMVANGELNSIMVRQALERSMFDYLYSVDTNKKWPADFVVLMINILGLEDLAENDRVLSQHLDYFHFKTVCKRNDWTKDEYVAHQKLQDSVNDILIAIRVSLFEDGETSAIKVLEDYISQDLFKNRKFVSEFRFRFLNELNQYFPGSFPLELSKEIEGCLDLLSLDGNDSFSDVLNNLKERKEASLEVSKYRDFAMKHPNSAKGICYRVFLGQSTLSNNISDKTYFIYKEVLNFLKYFSSFSEKAKYFEMIGDEALTNVKNWVTDIESVNGENFKKGTDKLQPLLTILKQWGVVLAIISFVSISYMGLDYLKVIPEFKSKDKLMGIGYLVLLGVGCWTIASGYHLYEKYIGHHIYGLRHQISVNQKLRKKTIGCLLVVSILVATLSNSWNLLFVYLMLLSVVSCFFLSGLMSLALVFLPFFPAMELAKLNGVHVDSEPNLILHVIMAWVMYGSYIGINHLKYKLMPGTSPHLIAIWTGLAAFYTFVVMYLAA